MANRKRESRQGLPGGVHTCAVVAMVLALVCVWTSASFAQPKAYVTNEKSNDLSVIDITTEKSLPPLPWVRGRVGFA